VSLSVVEELRWLEYGQRLRDQRRNRLYRSDQPMVGRTLYDAALSGGAQALGQPIGELTVGKRADWLVLDPNHASIAEHAPSAWLSGVVFCEHGETPIRDVYAGGDKVVDNRRHRDEEGAYARYRVALADLLK